MSSVIITLIIIGMIFLVGSFFVQEKLSQNDIERLAGLSEKEIHIIMDKHLNMAENRVDDVIDEAIEASISVTKRAMEKETNEKIMAISDYSDTVLEAMNKSHNEIMFLYNMLNDKHQDLTTLANQLQNYSAELKRTENDVMKYIADSANSIKQSAIAPAVPKKEAPKKVQTVQTVQDMQPEPSSDDLVSSVEMPQSGEMESEENMNLRILTLHAEGMADVDIARELGIGLGEVKLVIGLYRGEDFVET